MDAYASRIRTTRLFQELEARAQAGEILPTEVVQLQALVFQAAELAGPKLDGIQQVFEQYTQHNLEHSRNVAEHMAKILPAETIEKLNALELTLLLLAALLHDVGMAVSAEEAEQLNRDKSFRVFCQNWGADRLHAAEAARKRGEDWRAKRIETALFAEYIRRHHAHRVFGFLETHLGNDLVFRQVSLVKDLGALCESHAWPVEQGAPGMPSVADLPTNKRFGGVGVNLQYLACLLRLADILDFDRSRTPRIVFEGKAFTEAKSWEEWNKHLAVTGWELNATTVAYEAECSHPSFYVAVYDFLDWIDVELRSCRYLLDGQPATVPKHYRLTLPVALDRRGVRMEDPSVLPGGFRFQLDYEEILHLLMDKSLYPDDSLFLRELLQNALDACRRKEAEAKYVYGEEASRHYQPRIVVFDYSDDAENPRIEFMDNGVGMSQRVVERYFLRVGKSYYKSQEFEAERARYEAKGIELDACSQFGIGVLSCFMVADRLRVETYQHGHEPLTLEVDGPAKYFVIRRLPKPEPGQFDKQPETQEDDGPPGRTGTRVVVYLKDRTPLEVAEALETFAVNIDCPLVVRQMRGEQRRILQWGWRQGWQRDHVTLGLHALPAGSPLLVPEEVPLLSTLGRFDGSAWFWLLGDQEGKPALKVGDLFLDGYTIGFTGLPGFLQKACFFVGSDVRHLVGKLKLVLAGAPTSKIFEILADESYSFSSGDHLQIFNRTIDAVGGLIRDWEALSRQEQESAVENLEVLLARGTQIAWYERTEVVEALRKGDISWARSGIAFDVLRIEALYLRSVATQGIVLPLGIRRMTSFGAGLKAIGIGDFLGGALVDFRGRFSPSPSTNRMFVEASKAKVAIRDVVGSIAEKAMTIAAREADVAVARAWLTAVFGSLLSSSLAEGALEEALQPFLGEIRARFPFKLSDDQEWGPFFLGLEDLLQKFSDWDRGIPVLASGYFSVHLDATDAINRLLAPEIVKKNGEPVEFLPHSCFQSRGTS